MIWVTDSSGNLLIDASGQAVPVTDNGGSITVDGTVSISGSVAVTGTVGVSGTVAATQSGAWSVAATQSGAWSVSVSGTATVDTELPSAGALGDSMSNPTTPMVGAALLAYDDTANKWVRVRGYASDGLMVLARQDSVWAVSVSGAAAVTQSGAWTVSAVQSGSWAVSVSGAVTADTELPAAAGLSDAMAGPVTPSVGACLLGFNGSQWFRVRGDTTNGLLIQGTVTADTELPAAAALADGASNPTTPTLGSANLLFNGSTWDRRPGTQEGTLLASATRNATTDSAVQTNYGARGVLLTMNLTAAAGTGVKLEIRGVDPISSNDILLARFSANRTGTAQVHWLELHPGSASATPDAYGERYQGRLPRRWKLRVLHSDGNNLTYSVGYTLLP